MAEFTLHCFCQSGNAFKAASLLACAGADWEAVFVDFLGGETRTPAWREQVNEMGEVPVLEHRGLKLSQSGVILDYLAEALGRFGAESPEEKREIWRWILFDNHKFTSYFATHRWLRSLAPAAPEPAVLAFLEARADAAFAVVEKHLESQDFLVGGRPTIADFSLSGYLFYPPEETGYDLAGAFPAVHAWSQRLAALPGWQPPYELLPGERIAPRRSYPIKG
ncbi:glutathione S-transferase [Tistlia consotensis]|uniref:Glutathione S-transferase n=1 Tax=Tistlia consotensis USBA 355 TaxID=560819 RepID=A0A1Y6BPP4_9PROT|nr:glutathione S-transferase [Tistlia consotensis]SMF13627.1 glutathione S-transferase [Tistlia consotensis USBA 355]SNR50326.1 glutathione S-transferase [Tistlia consotensis]